MSRQIGDHAVVLGASMAGLLAARVLADAYIARLHGAAEHDASLAGVFVRVAGLVAPPQSLLRPSVAVRVLWGSLHPPIGTAVSSIGTPSRQPRPWRTKGS